MEVGNPATAPRQALWLHTTKATSLSLGLSVGSVAVPSPSSKRRPGHPPPLSFLTQLQDHTDSERATKVTPKNVETSGSGTSGGEAGIFTQGETLR